MALYGEARDISMFRHINREIMHNIISQQCVLYKYDVAETKVNIYGEGEEQVFYHPPVLLYCLIDTPRQGFPTSNMGVDFKWNPTFKFLRDDLLPETATSASALCCPTINDNPKGANIVPQPGDIIMYQKAYYEVDTADQSEFFVGKDPAYPFKDDNGNNPLETDLNRFGYNIALTCQTHYVPADKVQIQLERF